MSFNTNGVNLKGQFNLKNTDPIDGRFVVTTKAEYEDLTRLDASGKALYLYPGLTFTVSTDLTLNSGVKKPSGTYQVAADGKTINKIPKITILSSSPTDATPGEVGDICIVVEE